MRADVTDHVKTCNICQRNKTGHRLPTGLLESLEMPQRAWSRVSLDFITQLPEMTKGDTQIVAYVDSLTKMCHFSPLPTNANALDVATDFVTSVFKWHGLPETLISDRDAKFTSLIWQDIMRLCGITLSMSTAYHPQTDGQTERMNQEDAGGHAKALYCP